MANPKTNSFISPNPAMSRGFVEAEARRTLSGADEGRMTMNGTINITAFLFGALILTGAIGWYTAIPLLGIVCALAALVVGLVTSFKPHLAPRTALVYALLQGYFLGYISQSYNYAYDGIVVQALGLTVAIAVSLLLIYRTGVIKPSQNFKIGVAAATGGIFLFYMVSLGLSLFGITPPLTGSSNISIVFSLFVVALASANLVIDFDFIEEGVRSGAPKHMEWYGAFGLMVTVVWLYLELLRLLSKLRER